MNSVIKVENLSKKFIIGHEEKERYTALRDVMARKAKKIFSFPFALRAAKTLSAKGSLDVPLSSNITIALCASNICSNVFLVSANPLQEKSKHITNASFFIIVETYV